MNIYELKFKEEFEAEKEIKDKTQKCKTIREMLELKVTVLNRLADGLRARLGGYDKLIRELSKTIEKAEQPEEQGKPYHYNTFSLYRQFDLFVTDRAIVAEKIAETIDQTKEFSRQIDEIDKNN